LIDLVELRTTLLASVEYVFPQQFLGDLAFLFRFAVIDGPFTTNLLCVLRLRGILVGIGFNIS
jgi:hypothetical protein